MKDTLSKVNQKRFTKILRVHYREREVQKCVAYVKQRKGYISYIAFLQLIFYFKDVKEAIAKVDYFKSLGFEPITSVRTAMGLILLVIYSDKEGE